jgi:2,4-dienoyl-CoA reductase-like NADH-dependent reductase (Old Yellow Enzyme family)
MVAVGRALLQDPEWVVKIREGRHAELSAFDRSAMATLY